MDLVALQMNGLTSSAQEKQDILFSLEKAKSGAQRIGRLVERMRLHSRKGSGEKSLENINAVIEKAAELCANRLKYIAYETAFDEKLPDIPLNPQELEQVFVNLFKNAVDALDKKGGILKVSTALADEKIIIRFEDNGPGVHPEQGEKIFEAFYSTKSPESGTGLGLSVTRGIVESHGGQIHLEESKMGGAAFVIELPLEP